MTMLKGNYDLDKNVEPTDQPLDADGVLEQEYYKTALSKLGGSIAFVMKGKTFLWAGDAESALPISPGAPPVPDGAPEAKG